MLLYIVLHFFKDQTAFFYSCTVTYSTKIQKITINIILHLRHNFKDLFENQVVTERQSDEEDRKRDHETEMLM